MCSAFTPGCRYEISTTIVIGDVYCPNTKCSGKLCLHKKTFQCVGRSDYQCPQFGSVCQVRNIPFEDQANSFFFSLRQRVYIFEESQKSVQDGIGDVYCPGKYCSNREKCDTPSGYVTTARSIYACGMCGAWLFCSQNSFYVTRARKDDKNRQNTFFLLKKMNFAPNKQLLLNVLFQSSKYRQKELCVDNKVRETTGDVYCPTCRIEKCFYISTIKSTTFYDCK